MKHLGDITKISGSDVPIVDIVCGGSPCQDLSVAGLRKGLLHSDLGDGETTRSGLFMEQIRIIKEMREADRNGRSNDDIRHIRPRYMVWENVCGAFSSNKGEDFRAVLEETAKVADKDAVIPRPENGKWTYSGCIMGDGWSIAWRTHDAQYWGVPQRRKRICLVADFDGDTAGKILFDVQLRGETEYAETFKIVAGTGTDSGCEIQPVSEGLSRDSEQGKQEREGTSENAEGSVGTSSYTLKIHQGDGYAQSETMYTLNTIERHAVAYRKTGHPRNAEQAQGWQETDINDTLNAFDNGEVRTPTVVLNTTYQTVAGTLNQGAHPVSYNGLDMNGGYPACNQGGMAVVQGVEENLVR